MNKHLQELYDESIAAIYKGEKMANDFFERLDAPTAQEVAKAIKRGRLEKSF